MKRRVMLLVGAMAVALVMASGVALAASVSCPTASGGYCYGTNQGDAIYGSANLDRVYASGGSDLVKGYGGGDFLYGGSESSLGDKMLGGTGSDLLNGQGGDDLIEGGPGRDTLKTGKGSDRVEARDGEKDSITCEGQNDLVYYDKGLDVLEGCAEGARLAPPLPDNLFEPDAKVLVGQEGRELCVPEAALGMHLAHGGEVLSWTGCTEQQ